jgi:hypothetical protein
MIVSLSRGEMVLGATVGGARQAANMIRDAKDHNGAEVLDGALMHIIGARAEIAVCKALNLHWSGAFDLGAPDVGGCYEVRARSKPNYTDMRLEKKDEAKDCPFILAVPTSLKYDAFELLGWTTPREGCRQEYWKEYTPGRPAYFVPRGDLHRMEILTPPPTTVLQ